MSRNPNRSRWVTLTDPTDPGFALAVLVDADRPRLAHEASAVLDTLAEGMALAVALGAPGARLAALARQGVN